MLTQREIAVQLQDGQESPQMQNPLEHVCNYFANGVYSLALLHAHQLQVTLKWLSVSNIKLQGGLTVVASFK